ncbi:MAG TPA: GAF domain-containing sensor histidine kinase [Anaerolineae bacterium]|nr:GAF domain-containing sensor histidine kinase [Anaerolineae bacterium]
MLPARLSQHRLSKTPTQFLFLLLLLGAIGNVVVLAYLHAMITRTSQAGATLVALTHIQQGLDQLQIETNHMVRDRSTHFETLETCRQQLEAQLQRATREADGDSRITDALQQLPPLLAQYDDELNRLRANPVDDQFRGAAHQLASILDGLRTQVEMLCAEETQHLDQVLGATRKWQHAALVLTIGMSVLWGVSILLTLTVKRTPSGEAAPTYSHLKNEIHERRHAEEELRRQNEYLAALHATSLALMNRLDVNDLLETIVTRAAQLLDTPHGYIYLVNAGHNVLERKVGIGLFAQSIGFRLQAGQGLAGMVWRNEESLIVNQYATWPYHAPTPGSREETIKAVAGAPLLSGQRVVGVIGLAYDHDSGRTFGADEVRLLKGFAQLASIALDNACLFAEADQRTLQVQTLYHADEEIYRHLETNEVLQALVDVAVDILQADKSALLIWDADHRWLRPSAARGFMPETLDKMRFTADSGLVGHVATYAEPVVVRDTTTDQRVDWHITYPEHIRSFIHVPITIEGRVFGVFNVNYTETRAFGEDDLRLILALAQRAALALENARLYEQAQQAATLEERQRLARELHDAVTQTLFSASLIADVLPRLAQINPTEADRRLRELRDLTRGALAEMRTLLLELRPTVLSEAPIGELLHQLGEAITGRARVPVSVTTRLSCDLPADVKIAMYRIAQEALNNIAKHANAGQVSVTLHCVDDAAGIIELCISDDGIGFDVAQTLPDNLGLRIMRERAESVGATLAVDSHPNEGTQIHVSWKPD